jgi:S1-C subfamily serine protease
VTAQTGGWSAGLILASWLAPAALGQDMSKKMEDHVRRATVMVLMEIPGTRQGGSGTGEFINNNGLVLTNNHVVDPNHGKTIEERAKNFGRITLPKYQVVVDSGTERERVLPATLLHQSESGDMALLQVEDENGQPLSTPHYLSFVPEGWLAEDNKVWIFGFPGGTQRGMEVAITVGLITKLTDATSGAITYVETDATVHPGNSGGPVVDVAGRLVGVATHKRFGRGEKDRSGAVPSPLVQQFILTGFDEGRIPKPTDVLPLVSVFTDHNGIVEFPTYPRAADEATVHWQDGNIRRGKPASPAITTDTALGKFDVPLDRAAYLFVRDDQAVLVMDGGDKLAFPIGRLSLPVEFNGQQEQIRLADLNVIAFGRPGQPVSFPSGVGAVVQADGCRLGLAEIEGRVAVGGASYDLPEVARIESDKGRRRTLHTAKGERVQGELGGKAISGRVVWLSEPLSISLASVDHVAVRPQQWAFVNAGGRRLIDRLDIEGEDLAEIARLLDGPSWEAAGPKLKQAEQTGRRSREAKQQLKLFAAVHRLRSGDLPGAREEFDKLARKSDPAAGAAQCYATVLQHNADGTFLGVPLTEPDAIWRASSQAAGEMLADLDERITRLDQLPYRKKARELEQLEKDIDTANRLEIGIAQSKLMQLLEKSYFAHIEGYEEIRQEYSETVQEHNRARLRRQQQKTERKLKSMEGKLKKTSEEIGRIYARLLEESVGFAVEPPKFD